MADGALSRGSGGQHKFVPLRRRLATVSGAFTSCMRNVCVAFEKDFCMLVDVVVYFDLGERLPCSRAGGGCGRGSSEIFF